MPNPYPKQQRYLVAYSRPRPTDDDDWGAYSTWATSPAAAIEQRRVTAETIHVFEFEKEGLTFRATRDYVLEPKTYEQPEPPGSTGLLGEDGAEVLGL